MKFKDLCVDLINEILEWIIFEIWMIEDMYYYFSWDKGRKIYLMKSVKINFKISELPERLEFNYLFLNRWNTISKIPKGLKCQILNICCSTIY